MELTTVIVDSHGFPTKPTRNSNGKLVSLSTLHPRIPVTDVPYFQLEQIYTNHASYGVGTLYEASKGLVEELIRRDKLSKDVVDTFKQLNPQYNVYIGARLISYNKYDLNVLFGWIDEDVQERVIFTELDAHANLYSKNGTNLTEKDKSKLSFLNNNLHVLDNQLDYLNEPYLIELSLDKDTVQLLKYRTSDGVDGIKEGRRMTYTPIYLDNSLEELLIINGDDYVYLKNEVVQKISLDTLITNLKFILSPIYSNLKSENNIDTITLEFKNNKLEMKFYRDSIETPVEISYLDKEYLLKVIVHQLNKEQVKED